MAPPPTAKQPGSTAAECHPRQSRNARSKVVEDVNDDDHADDSADVDDEAEDDDIEPSQGTAVQSMIIGGLNNVWQSMLVRNHLWDVLTDATAEKAAHREQETSKGEVQPH
jgi:hypothetical protein